MAIEHGIQYDKCQAESDKLACILDKALANVGAIFAGQVEGRVSTEVDPRVAYDTGLHACIGLGLPVQMVCAAYWLVFKSFHALACITCAMQTKCSLGLML